MNFSSQGMLIASQEAVQVGAGIELRLPWPVEVGGTVRLQFIGSGKVVRSERTGFAVHLTWHEFRTLGREARASSKGLRRPRSARRFPWRAFSRR